MDPQPLDWVVPPNTHYPENWAQAIAQALPQAPSHLERLTQVLWQRQLCPPAALAGFLNPACYQPTPSAAFGPPMVAAVKRLNQAADAGEKVAIWGDFDADGVTATALLWEGLGRVFPRSDRLMYFIPNRLKESHGLSRRGLELIHGWGATLVVTCDTGSTNGAEIAYAADLGMDVIVTDHHTLPEVDPPAIAMINPRRLPPEHPLATLSGVAVAYKLVEGLFASRELSAHLDSLLDLVAIGLIADLVELRGDCRYLAQIGLQQLHSHSQAGANSRRPGVTELLALCRRTGDRPTDIAFGLGPRINAVSRIQGDASFCVELLTSQDVARCKNLAYEAELANTRRKALQRDVYGQVMARLAQVDLGTTQCIVLADEQWPTGILGLVAGQVAQQMGRPVVLLHIDPPPINLPPTDGLPRLARGSARSVQGLDLYTLFQAQADLLTGFGGHPMAAGLTLPVDNIELLAAALNRMVREALGGDRMPRPTLQIDLTVTVAELGQALFRELKYLEPCGMGNPVPRLLVRNGWVQRGFHRKLRDQTNAAVGFIKTEFELWDDSVQSGFPGEWWGHYKEDLPPGRCDVVVELDHNTYAGYHIKLIDHRPTQVPTPRAAPSPVTILDWRQADPIPNQPALVVKQPPVQWHDWHAWQQQAAAAAMPLALAFSPGADQPTPHQVWQHLVGLAKYLARTQTAVTADQLMARLSLTPLSLKRGLNALTQVGFDWSDATGLVQRTAIAPTQDAHGAIAQFLDTLQEEQFRRRYFTNVPVSTLVPD
ncbi:single-stranded-DNA-specific exonuclease RecJ [Nodosilinea sp. P-1105]|uniref:single-stranded-DNA-specific exonuclease RecJ n=1 Tax=Nodosilinea sp. P-1105 TaxID=2546229 RepID=UPI001469E7DC|nr:single-stranded-DNA-specific exonuclease RecJ [Nodosilinea sp. P-1105]NMF85577.1 single-stranded-DNA-specific exonuclease RecJ [Nodosilinea sp. P-1105]